VSGDRGAGGGHPAGGENIGGEGPEPLRGELQRLDGWDILTSRW